MEIPTTADCGSLVITVDTVSVTDTRTTEVTVLGIILTVNSVSSTGTSGELKFFDKPCKKNFYNKKIIIVDQLGVILFFSITNGW